MKLDPTTPFAGPKRFYIVEVIDSGVRFQTCRIRTSAPEKGIAGFALQSQPGRTVGLGRIAFRAELWDSANNRAAAFAVLTVKLAGNGGTNADLIKKSQDYTKGHHPVARLVPESLGEEKLVR